jgi:hypothetical protein
MVSSEKTHGFKSSNFTYEETLVTETFVTGKVHICGRLEEKLTKLAKNNLDIILKIKILPLTVMIGVFFSLKYFFDIIGRLESLLATSLHVAHL